MLRTILLVGAVLAVPSGVPAQGGDPLTDAESILGKVGTRPAGGLRAAPLAPAPPPGPAVVGTWVNRDPSGSVLTFTFQDGGGFGANFAGSARDGNWKATGDRVTVDISAKGPRPAIHIEFAVAGPSMTAEVYTVGGKPSVNKGRVFHKQ